MSFPPRFLDELRDRIGLADLIGQRVKLTRKGREFSGLCPFHNEKTPSFTVNEEKGFYHCFGCGAHGDAIGFTMQIDGLSFPEAVERLADLAGVPVPAASPAERERAKAEATQHQIVEAATRWFEAELHGPAGRGAMAYLRDRGLAENTIRRFRLGFAPDDRAALKRALIGQGIAEPLLVEAGLLIRPDDARPSYDRFRGRVMFPILDGRGRPIAFGGRILGAGEPKYLNSPDTPLFNKGRVLFGLAAARRAATERKRLLVVEGYMDVIALAQAGFGETVAPLGTALTEDQLALGWRLAPDLVLCFDGDGAGRRAALRAIDRALPVLSAEKSVRLVALPQGEDPDSLVRTGGAAAFETVLASAAPVSRAIRDIEAAAGGLEAPEGRARLAERLRGWSRKLADRTLQREFEAYFENEVAALSAAVAPRGRAGRVERGRFAKAPPRGVVPGFVARPPAEIFRRRREQVLLAGLVHHPFLLDECAEDLGRVNLSDPKLDKLRQELLKITAREAGLDVEGLARHLMEHGFADVLQGLRGPEIVRVHGPFTRSDAPGEEARAGVRQALAFLLGRSVDDASGDAAAAGAGERMDGPL